MEFCQSGDIDKVNEYLKDSTNLTQRDITLVFNMAAESGNIDMMKCMLDHAENSNYVINPPNPRLIAEWVSSGNFRLFKFLIEYSNLINSPIDVYAGGESIFVLACVYGHLDIVKYLIEYATSIDRPFAIHDYGENMIANICKNASVDMIKCIFSYAESLESPIDIHNHDDIIFINMCSYSRIDLVMFLVEYSKSIGDPINPNTSRGQGFAWACGNNCTTLVEYLLDYGLSNNTPINIHMGGEEAFRRACSLRSGCEIYEILVKESIKTDIKYLYDPVKYTGYIFKEGLDPDKPGVHDYNGTLAESICGPWDVKFLDENIHKLARKKSAR